MTQAARFKARFELEAVAEKNETFSLSRRTRSLYYLTDLLIRKIINSRLLIRMGDPLDDIESGKDDSVSWL